MVPWKSFACVLSKIQCKEKDFKIQNQNQFCVKYNNFYQIEDVKFTFLSIHWILNVSYDIIKQKINVWCFFLKKPGDLGFVLKTVNYFWNFDRRYFLHTRYWLSFSFFERP